MMTTLKTDFKLGEMIYHEGKGGARSRHQARYTLNQSTRFLRGFGEALGLSTVSLTFLSTTLTISPGCLT